MSVAQEEAPADVVLRGGRVVDVYGRKIIEGRVLAFADQWIAFVGSEQGSLVGPETRVENLGGAYVLPGFIDAHTHLDSMFQCAAFVEKALPFGNTTCVTETAMMAAALGPKGVDLFCQDAAGLPMRIFFLSPSLVPPLPGLETSAGFDDQAFERFIARPDVLGLGETYWSPGLIHDSRMPRRFAQTQALNKTLEGHGAGARDQRLMAYRAGGVSACHEATTLKEAQERLSLGMAVMIREGYIRREMAQILPGLSPDELDSGLVMLVTDLADPEELVSQGGMNLLLKKAVALGLDPLRAVRMLTLHPARYFHLRSLGAIAPGNLADVVAVEDLKSFTVAAVWVSGQKVAAEGRMEAEIDQFSYPAWTRQSLNIGSLRAESFRLPVEGARARAKVVVPTGETITRLEEHELEAREGQIRPDVGRDILKMAHLDRRGLTPPAVGLIKGLGFKAGALAASLIWDTNNVLVVGTDEAEMARAVNRLVEIGGGFVVWRQDRCETEWPLEVGGIISAENLKVMVSRVKGVEEACRRLGCTLARPVLTFQTLAFTGLPFFRLTDKGLVDVRRGELMSVV